MSKIPEDFIFKDMKNQTLLKMPNTINSQVFNMEKLSDCEVFILDISETIYIDNCSNCKFYVAPVRGSFYIRDSQNCTCSVSCKQLRAKNCTGITFFLYSVSDPHIESSFDMKFAPYNFSYPGQNVDFKKVGFDEKQNKWCKVYDHSSAEGDGHFSLLPSNQFKKVEKKLNGYGNPVNPVPIPQQYGGDLKAEIVPGSKPESRPLPKDLPPAQSPKPPPMASSSSTLAQSNPQSNPKHKSEDIGNLNETKIVNKDYQGTMEIYYDPKEGFCATSIALQGLFNENEIKGKFEQFDEINTQYYPIWNESLLAIFLSVIGFLVILLIMSLMKMSSEWKVEATGVFLTIALISLLFIIITLIIKVKRLEKAWTEIITEAANQQNSDYFEGKDAKISATFTTLTITIGNS